MLARSAYQPASQRAEHKPQAASTPFQVEPARKTVKSSPAVQIELSDAARSALLGLQEIAAPPPKLNSSMEPGPRTVPQQAKPYVSPGATLNLSV